MGKRNFRMLREGVEEIEAEVQETEQAENPPYYIDADGQKKEVKNVNDLLRMLKNPNVKVRFGVQGCYISYAIIDGSGEGSNKGINVNSVVGFDIVDSEKKESGKDFLVYELETGKEIERFDVEELEAVDEGDKAALRKIIERGVNAVTKAGVMTHKAKSNGIKLVHITNFMFQHCDFNKRYRELKDKGRVTVQDFLKNPEMKNQYMMDPYSDWNSNWNAYCRKKMLTQQQADDLLKNMPDDVFIDVVTKEYGSRKKPLTKSEIDDISQDPSRIKTYIDSLDKDEWSKKAKNYCKYNDISSEAVERLCDPEQLSPQEFKDIVDTPKTSEMLRLVFYNKEGERIIWSDYDKDLYYIFIEDDDFYMQISHDTYKKIKSYFKKEETPKQKANDLDKALFQMSVDQNFRNYTMDNIIMLRFYYTLPGDNQNRPRKFVYINYDDLRGFGSDAAKLVAHDALEALRTQFKNKKIEMTIGKEKPFKIVEEGHLMTFNEYRMFVEGSELTSEGFETFNCSPKYGFVLEKAMTDIEPSTTVKFSEIKDAFKADDPNGIYKIIGAIDYSSEWKENSASEGDVTLGEDGGNSTLQYTDKSGSTKFFKLSPDADVQFDNKDFAAIIKLDTSDSFLEVFFDERSYKNMLTLIK